MPKIFISYSRRDSQFVDSLIPRLQSSGGSVWVDRESIRGGAQWREQIVKAIQTSNVFLLILSPNSVKSENVRKELDLAEGADIQIIPIEIKLTKIPPEMMFQLVGLQKIDFISSFDKGYSALLSAIIGGPLIKKDKEPPSQGFWSRWLKTTRWKLTAAVALVIIAVIFGFTLSKNVQCSSSSFQSDFTNCLLCTCRKAFDDNPSTRWASKWKDDEWIIRDLGVPTAIDTVVLQWEAAYGKEYTIDVSNDKLSWTTVYTQKNGRGGVETITFPLTITRYVRMQGISRGTEYDTPNNRPYGYSLWEFQIYQAAQRR